MNGYAMFDSPLEMCLVCGDWVLLDQTRKECAREHHCTVERCPLERFFTGFDFSRPIEEFAAPVPAGKLRSD